MGIFFTSDSHFNHKNVISHCNRPFELVEEMNEKLIENWNSVVSKNDHVYHLGDFSLGNETETLYVLNQLNGNKFLVLGNHDYVIQKNKSIQNKFSWIKDYYNLILDDKQMICLFHYPIQSWRKKQHGSIHLHGHSHGEMPSENIKRYDVGVDTNDFTPVNLEVIIDKFK